MSGEAKHQDQWRSTGVAACSIRDLPCFTPSIIFSKILKAAQAVTGPAARGPPGGEDLVVEERD
jgi:hypothetical protein